MNDTVACKTVQCWWNGKVIIDEIKIYADTRGMVSEVWRIDSLMGKDSKQCYISETAPYVMRGPHEHVGQVDEFVSWKNNMVYQMFNPETGEMKTFTTQKDKIYRVHVAIGIIHSYRNLDAQKSFTLNFPTALFMGEGKKDKIDEIRHEVKYEHNDVIVVFGAGGKLGQSITTEFFANMGEHKYDVVPSYEKLKNKEEVEEFFGKLDLALGKDRQVFLINCAALTNVQDVDTQESIWEWSNVTLPVEFAKKCNDRKWKLVQFSSDYVYQKVETNIINYNLSSYTRSKMRMETALKNLEQDNILLLRVANLFSSDDPHNAIVKMKTALKNNGVIKVDPRLAIFPSHVDDVSDKIFDLYYSDRFGLHKSYTEWNLVPSKRYLLDEFVREFFKVEPILENGRIQPWARQFMNPELFKGFASSSDKIKELI
jgi:dTDP-4-dehydrorhamnose 3,5-epimerase